MPLIASSTYRPPWGLANGHLQTILPVLFRRVAPINCERERIETPDGDFLDLDWNRDQRSQSLVMITHGLEGNSANASVQGMAAAFHRAGWDTLAWNLRGCSGEMNRLLRTYHSGAWEDLQCVINHAAGTYQNIVLVGFSIGGNLTLKYLGDHGAAIHPSIKGAVAFSVPCDLASSARVLESRINSIYMNHFLQDLRWKIREKAKGREEWEASLCRRGRSRRRFFGLLLRFQPELAAGGVDVVTFFATQRDHDFLLVELVGKGLAHVVGRTFPRKPVHLVVRNQIHLRMQPVR
jgi:predicted alpha/beta-fold hydrolase